MSSHDIPIATARLSMALFRYPDDRALSGIWSHLPGMEDNVEHQWCSLRESDEAYTWLNDFHGSSKAWRSLMDCVTSDWVSNVSHPWESNYKS